VSLAEIPRNYDDLLSNVLLELKKLDPDQLLQIEQILSHQKHFKKDSIFRYGQSIEEALNHFFILATTDKDGKITFVNDKFCEISKYSKQELLGQDHRLLNSDYHSKLFFQNLWKTIKSGATWRGQIRNKTKDGSIYWVDSLIAPLKKGEEVQGYIAIRFDITKEKRRELIRLEISDLRGLYIELSKNKSVFYNHLLDALLRISESEFGFVGDICRDEKGPYLKTQSITDISWNEESRNFYKNNAPAGLVFRNLNTLFGEVIKTGRPIITNQPASHPQAGGTPPGHPELKSFMGLPIFYSGELVAMIGVANRKGGYQDNFVNELALFIDFIGEMIHTSRLNESLEIQRELSQRSAKFASLGQLAAGVGHEINNPLAIIQGMLGMVKSELSGPGISLPGVFDKLDRIEHAVGRIANIVKGLRTFSRADKEENADFNLHDLALETVNILKEIFLKEGVEINFESQNSSGFLFGNRGRLQQVLVNLLTNAKDATENRFPRKVDLKLREIDKKLIIEVSDNGVGIPTEIQEKIFEPFFTTKAVNKGTGLGLAIAGTIIKQFDGEIKLSSEMGVGSTFTLILKASDGNHVSHPKPETSPDLKPAPSNKSAPLRILVVDDEEDLRDILSFMLIQLGMQVEVAGNGKEALGKLNSMPFDLVISDMKMPIMDGIRLLENIRANPDLRTMKFVFITGGVDIDKELLDKISQQSQGLIGKPFRPPQIREKLLELFPERMLKN
jgi:PAS domain S-box-containing protein